MSEANRVDHISAVIAALSMTVAAGAFIYSIHTNNQTNDRLAEQTSREFVQRVSLQEAPHYACARHSQCSEAGVQWVLVNFNPIQLVDVWVEGPKATSIKMFNVPACSMYALPVKFRPTAAHFEDPHGQWRVLSKGALSAASNDFPKEDTGDSPWTDDVANCP